MRIKKVDIAPYTSYFHDGEVSSIRHKNNIIKLGLESAEIDPDIVKDIQLSKNNRIKGVLHIEGIKLLLNNGNECKEKIKMLLPDNDLLHLEIHEGVVFCQIGWRGQNAREIDFSGFEIHATKVWWENIPDLS